MLPETTARPESDVHDSAPSAVATEQPAKPVLDAVMARIGRDSARDAAGYLRETEVPHGGE